MALPEISKSRNLLATVATFWMPFGAYRRALRGIVQLGVGRYIRTLRSDRRRKFENTLSVVAIIKDEGDYIKEWIDFHILVGVDKFYLYDNESTDNTREILEPYIRRGIVEYTFFPGDARQNPAYIDFFNRHADDTRWAALIDADEFLVPIEHETVPEFLATLPRFSALVVTWCNYGSSGHKTKQPGLVIENYKRHAAKVWGVKSIVNPRLVVSQKNPHLNKFAGFVIDENGRRLGHVDQTNNPPSINKLRCNHYATKSAAEYFARCAKGSAASGKNSDHKKWTQAKFDLRDRNEVYDPIMDKYIERLKKM